MRNIVLMMALLTSIGTVNAALGYELIDSGKVLHLYNDYDSYYFNTTSGIQFTNHNDEYWSKNIFCGGYNSGSGWNYICNDALPFTWSITNTTTQINVTGYRDKTIGLKKVRVGLEYILGVNDTNLSVVPSMTMLKGNFAGDLRFIWEITNINIGSNNYTDGININDSFYYLNETFNASFTNLSETLLYYGDVETLENLWVWWKPSLNYKVKINEDKSQLIINTGGINEGQTKNTVMNWHDALCFVSGCNIETPNPNPITVNNLADSGMMFDFSSGKDCLNRLMKYQYDSGSGYITVPVNGQNLTAPSGGTQVSNPSDAVWYDVDIQANETGIYDLRVQCQYGFPVNYYYAYDTLTIEVAPESNCDGYFQVVENITFTDNNASCFNFTSSNLEIDCNGYTIIGQNYTSDYVIINNYGVQNLSVKNCLVTDAANIINFAGVNTFNISNNTVFNASIEKVEDILLNAFYINSSSNGVLTHASIINVSGYTTDEANCHDGEAVLLRSINSSNITFHEPVINVFYVEYTEDQDSGAGGCQDGRNNISKYLDCDDTNGLYMDMTSIGTATSTPLTYDNCEGSIKDCTINFDGGLDAITISNSDDFLISGVLFNSSDNRITITQSSNIKIYNSYFVGNDSDADNEIDFSNSVDGVIINVSMHNGDGQIVSGTNSQMNLSNVSMTNLSYSGSSSAMLYLRGGYASGIFMENVTITGLYTAAFGDSQDAFFLDNFTIRDVYGSGIFLNAIVYNSLISNGSIENVSGVDILNAVAEKTNIIDVYFNKSNYDYLAASTSYSSYIGYTIKVNVTANGSVPLSDVYVEIKNNNENVIWTNYTHTNGLTDEQAIYEYLQWGDANYGDNCSNTTGNIQCLTPHNISANKLVGDNTITVFKVITIMSAMIINLPMGFSVGAFASIEQSLYYFFWFAVWITFIIMLYTLKGKNGDTIQLINIIQVFIAIGLAIALAGLINILSIIMAAAGVGIGLSKALSDKK